MKNILKPYFDIENGKIGHEMFGVREKKLWEGEEVGISNELKFLSYAHFLSNTYTYELKFISKFPSVLSRFENKRYPDTIRLLEFFNELEDIFKLITKAWYFRVLLSIITTVIFIEN